MLFLFEYVRLMLILILINSTQMASGQKYGNYDGEFIVLNLNLFVEIVL